MTEPTTEQLGAISAAIGVAVDQGISREQLAAALAQELPEEARAAQERSRMILAALSTVAMMAMKAGYDDGVIHAHRRIFYLGWRAANDRTDIGEITAEDFDGGD